MTAPSTVNTPTPARREVRTLIETMRAGTPDHRTVDQDTAPTSPAPESGPYSGPVLDALPARALVVDRVEACALTDYERRELKAALRRAGLPSFDRLA